MIKNFLEKYKNLNFIQRFFVVIIIIGGLSSYYTWTLIEDLKIKKTTASESLDEKKNKLSKVIIESKRIPKMKRSLIKAEILFNNSKNMLPDKFYIDETLDKISNLAKSSGLNLKLYDPGVPQKEEGSYTFISLPTSIIVVGDYNNIMKFMEHILNLEQLLEIRNYKLELVFSESKLTKSDTDKEISESEIQNFARNNSKVILEAELYSFRSLSEQEFKNISKTGNKKNKRKKRREK